MRPAPALRAPWLQVLFWTDSVLAVLFSLMLPFFLFTRHKHGIENLSGLWILPVVPGLCAASTAAAVSQTCSESAARHIFFVSGYLWQARPHAPACETAAATAAAAAARPACTYCRQRRRSGRGHWSQAPLRMPSSLCACRGVSLILSLMIITLYLARLIQYNLPPRYVECAV